MQRMHITITKGMRGYFAVMRSTDGDAITTSPFSHKTYEEALEEAKEWAYLERMQLIPSASMCDMKLVGGKE